MQRVSTVQTASRENETKNVARKKKLCKKINKTSLVSIKRKAGALDQDSAVFISRLTALAMTARLKYLPPPSLLSRRLFVNLHH